MFDAVMDPTFILANYLEACLWTTFAVMAFLRRRGPASGWLAAALLMFGVSDVVEAQTGAWYRPWPLLVLKSLCVLSIAISGWLLWRTRRMTP